VSKQNRLIKSVKNSSKEDMKSKDGIDKLQLSCSLLVSEHKLLQSLTNSFAENPVHIQDYNPVKMIEEEI
jgi:hypothetical protein